MDRILIVVMGVCAAAAITGAEEPRNCEDLLAEANALAARGDYAAGAEAYAAAFGAPSSAFDCQLAAYYLRAYCHERLRDWTTAEDLYRRMTEVYGEAYRESEWVRRGWLGLGHCMVRFGRWTEALRAYRQVADGALKDPVTIEALFGLASVYAHPRNPEADLIEAFHLYNEVLTQRPDHAAAAFGLAETLRMLGYIDEAIDAYDRTVELDPTGVWGSSAQTMTATLLRQKGQQTEARQRFQDVLTNDANASNVFGEYARLNTDEGMAALGQQLMVGNWMLPPGSEVWPAEAASMEEAPADADASRARSARWELRAAAMEQSAGVSYFSGPVQVVSRSAVIECASASYRASASLLACHGDVRVIQDRLRLRLPIDELILRVTEREFSLSIGNVKPAATGP